VACGGVGSERSRAAQSGAVPSAETPIDRDLAKIVAAWPTLSDAVRAGILAMVRASAGGDPAKGVTP